MPLDFVVAVDVLSIHYDPQLWGPHNPNEFHPERFSPEYKRNPLAFLAFGVGPRNCIGKSYLNDWTFLGSSNFIFYLKAKNSL